MILWRGAYLEYDNTGNPATLTGERKLAAAIELLRKGHAAIQLLLSMAACLRLRLHAWGGHRLDYLQGTFLPALHQAGASEERIHAITVDNVARVLAF